LRYSSETFSQKDFYTNILLTLYSIGISNITP
jgi:hypothetical protein